MNRVAIYILGAILLTAGLGYAAFLVGVPAHWIGVGAIVIIGLGIMGAATSAKGTAKTNVRIDEN
jgi:hypothetical protein